MRMLTLALLLLAAGACLAVPGRVTVHPADTGAALVNPGMGWVLFYYSNVPTNYGSRLAPSDTVDDFPGLGTVYLRLPWSYLEPEEGHFTWSILDTPAQRWIAKGKQVCFRFSCSESWLRYATPQWVEQAGAKGYNFEPGRLDPQGGLWEPDFDDPVFLEKLDHFLAAAAARYDGDPSVAFVDVGSFGVWGEGHTLVSTLIPYSADTIRRHIDLYRKHFPRTLLVANDDFALQGRGAQTLEYAAKQGLALRDDSILVRGGKEAYLSAAEAQRFWPTQPVILECEHYGPSKERGCWEDGAKYLEAVEKYHASYAGIHWWPREFLEANRELIGKINRRLGYRLQVLEASWPEETFPQADFAFTARWRNAGVAPCYGGGHPALTLKDAQGGIACVLADEEFNVRDLPVGEPDKAKEVEEQVTFTLPTNLKPGDYDLYLSVGSLTGTPKIALPLPWEDGARRYRLGKVRVLGDYSVATGDLVKRGEQWLLPCTWTVHHPLPEGTVPFCHFDTGQEIAFQGAPASFATAWGKPGVYEVGCTFEIPPEARGKSYQVLVGLWVPSRAARGESRLVCARAAADRRVAVGTLDVDAKGVPTFKPVASVRPGR